MKTIYKILLFLIIPLSFLFLSNYTFALEENLTTGWSTTSNGIINTPLNNLEWTNDFGVSGSWAKSIYSFMVNIAKDLKNIFFYIAWLYFLILVIKLIFTWESDEDILAFKKWIIWISIWVILTQIAYSFVQVLYGKDIWEWLANDFNKDIVYPLVELLETWVSFFFIAIAIYTFFRMITANGDEEKTKKWRYSIIYAIAWFIAVKFARILVDTIYWKIDCNDINIGWIIEISFNECTRNVDLNWFAAMVVNIINWMNWFIWIIVVILIMYVWIQLIFSVWDEEALKKAKTSIMYISLWIVLLFVNYLILTFFIRPEVPIIPVS
jgi:hypothetical protein